MLIRTLRRVLLALSLLLLWKPAGAQEADAHVLDPGRLRLGVSGVFTGFDERFGAEGGVQPLAADVAQPLVAGSFEPLTLLAPELTRLFALSAQLPEASPVQVTDALLSAGTPAVEAAATARLVPLEAALGVLPRLELFARLPLVRGELLVQRFDLAGATVGLNPAPLDNAEVLALIEGGDFGALAGAPLLPVAGSVLGSELQARVRALTGRELLLPADALTAAELRQLLADELGLASDSEVEPWRAGDLEVGARVQLLNTLGRRFYPEPGSALELRAAVSASARLPTGTDTNPLALLLVAPPAGLGGYSVGGEADVFHGDRFWGTLTVRFAALQPTEVVRRLVRLDRPLLGRARGPVEWDPGDELRLALLPRVRIAEVLSLGGVYALTRVGASSFTRLSDGAPAAAPLFATGSATLHQLGLTTRYSTFPAATRGDGVVPLDVRFSYLAAVAGGGRLPKSGTVVVEARVMPRAW